MTFKLKGQGTIYDWTEHVKTIKKWAGCICMVLFFLNFINV